MNLRNQSIINTAGNVTYLAAQWLLTVLTTRQLGYGAAGVLTLAMSVGSVFTFIQLYGVRGFQSSDTAWQYSSGDYLRARLVTAASGLLLCLLFCLGGHYGRETNLSIILFTLFRTFEAVSDVYFGDFQRQGRLEAVGITMFARGLLTVALFWGGLRLFHDLNAALAAIVSVSLVMTLVVDTVLYRRIVPAMPGSSSGAAGILKACFPLLLASLLPSVITAFPRIQLERFCGTELLGYYGNISTPAVIITAVVPNIIASVMPLYGEMAGGKRYSEMNRLWMKTLLGTVVILMLCLLCVFLFGKAVLAWIYTETIVPYVPYLYYVLLANSVYAFTMCGAALLIALRKNAAVSICAIVATAVCLLVSGPLVTKHGISGAIAVLIVSYMIQFILQVVLILRYTIINRNHAYAE